MFSRISYITKPAAQGAAGMASRLGVQARFASNTAPGSLGRKMPAPRSRATAPVKNLDATLTIRVST